MPNKFKIQKTSKFKTDHRLFRFLDNCSENTAQFDRLLDQVVSLSIDGFLFAAIQETQMKPALLGFLSANSDTVKKVLFAERFIRLNIIRGDRTGGAQRLSRVNAIALSSGQSFHKRANCLREQIGSLFQVVSF